MNYTSLNIPKLYNDPVKKNKGRLWMFTLSIFIILIQAVNVDQGKLLIPLSLRRDVMFEVKSKLAAKVNTYNLHNPTSFIPAVLADSAIAKDARAYALVDFESGDVIAEKNLAKRVPIASLTKIMTAVVALDLASPEDLFAVSPKAASQIPTKIVVWPGEKMSLWELLNASLLTSANDATYVIKEGVDKKYDKEVFVEAMNKKAELIGLRDTHFVNPQGFDNPDQYSSAEDLAVLSHYALASYPIIDDIVKKSEEYLAANPYHHAHHLVNWNGLIGVYPEVYGLKIGNTPAAGTTTVVVSERNGRKILAVVLGTPDVLSRDMQSAELLDFGYEQLMNLPSVSVTEDQLYEKYATWN